MRNRNSRRDPDIYRSVDTYVRVHLYVHTCRRYTHTPQWPSDVYGVGRGAVGRIGSADSSSLRRRDRRNLSDIHRHHPRGKGLAPRWTKARQTSHPQEDAPCHSGANYRASNSKQPPFVELPKKGLEFPLRDSLLATPP